MALYGLSDRRHDMIRPKGNKCSVIEGAVDYDERRSEKYD